MNNSLITSDGLRQLARIFVSCKPIMTEIMVDNQLKLIKTSKQGKDVNFDEFTANLPKKDPTYDQILQFAQSLGQTNIDENIVWKFFGSKPHFDKILGQINEYRLKKDFAQKIFFAHILVPVVITDIHKNTYPDQLFNFNAEYKNKNVVVKIKNLIASPALGEINPGQVVLSHYATIIATDVPTETVNYLLEVQAEKGEFIEACQYVQSIDYADFWSLRQWTESTIKERDI
jgi:hypothetical protein